MEYTINNPGFTKPQLESEINHFKTLLSAKGGKVSLKQKKVLNEHIERYQGWLDNFDKLDVNHDGILSEKERE